MLSLGHADERYRHLNLHVEWQHMSINAEDAYVVSSKIFRRRTVARRAYLATDTS